MDDTFWLSACVVAESIEPTSKGSPKRVTPAKLPQVRAGHRFRAAFALGNVKTNLF